MRFTILAVAALTAAGAAGCGSSGDDSTSSSSPAPTGAQKVNIASFKYAPPTISVKAGMPVTFTNSDRAPHTATSDQAGAFDTGSLQQGGSKPVRLAKPGRYAYHCDFHPFMHGVVVVR